MILVSSCLLGIKAKYTGGDNLVKDLLDLCSKGMIVPACPEQLGGLPTPRLPAEIMGGTGIDVLQGRAKVYDHQANDLTELFMAGAREVLRICQLFNIKTAILKERSPSCGCNMIYDGSFQSIRIKGSGVTAALLVAAGIAVYSEEELTAEILRECFTK